MGESFSIEFDRSSGVIRVNGGDKAWVAEQVALLIPALGEAAPDTAAPPTPPHDAAGDGAGAKAERRRPPKERKAASPKPAGAVGRDDIRAKLGVAPLDDFPEGAEGASAGIAGYATLRWARDTLGEDGLTVPEIYSFLYGRLRQPNSSPAYLIAFKRDPRAVSGSGNPTVWRLMKPGDAALDAYLAKREAGGTAPEAKAAARVAEDASA